MPFGWSERLRQKHAERRQRVAALLASRVVPAESYEDAYWALETALAAVRTALGHCGIPPDGCVAVDIAAREAVLKCARKRSP